MTTTTDYSTTITTITTITITTIAIIAITIAIAITRKPPLSPTQHLHGFQVQWRGILSGRVEGNLRDVSTEFLENH